MESMTLLDSRGKLSIAKREAETTHSAGIHDALQTESPSKAAWMLSCSSSGISFAKSNRGIQNERLFSAEEFRCTLRSKLGAGPIENTPHTEYVTLSIALATTHFTDATAISTHCTATMRSSGPSETTRRNSSACPTKPSILQLMPAPLPVQTSLLQRG